MGKKYKCNANKTQNLERGKQAIEKRRPKKKQGSGEHKAKEEERNQCRARQRKKINIWNHSSISACQKNVVKTSHFNLCFIITFYSWWCCWSFRLVSGSASTQVQTSFDERSVVGINKTSFVDNFTKGFAASS